MFLETLFQPWFERVFFYYLIEVAPILKSNHSFAKPQINIPGVFRQEEAFLPFLCFGGIDRFKKNISAGFANEVYLHRIY